MGERGAAKPFLESERGLGGNPPPNNVAQPPPLPQPGGGFLTILALLEWQGSGPGIRQIRGDFALEGETLNIIRKS